MKNNCQEIKKISKKST